MILLTREQLIDINTRLIKKYSSKEFLGVRDSKALDMLIKAPQSTFFGEELYPTIFDKAAILVINVATKHVFHNGNKRTALTALHVFMKMNGYETEWGFQEGIDFVLWVVTEHEKTDNFDQYKTEVVEKITQKYVKKVSD